MQTQQNRWTIAIMGTLMQVALGTVYAWSFFQQPVMKANDWTNSQAAWAFSLAIFFLGISAAWGGIQLPKWGPRNMAMAGGFCYGAGYVIASFALSTQNLPLLYIGYGVVGGIGLGLGYVTPVATAAKWFPDKKGFITGMVVMGFGFGALIMAKVLAPMLMSLLNNDLPQVFLWIGVVMLAVTLPAGYFLVNPPQGFVPEGYTPPAQTAGEEGASASITAKDCVFSAQFFMMWLVFFLNITAGIMFIGFQSPLLQDLIKAGAPALMADSSQEAIAKLAAAGATLIAVSSIFNGVGRFFWGAISDKIGRTAVFRILLGSQVLVFVALLFVTSPFVFSVFVCYILLCYGGGFGAMPSFILDVFGAKLMPVVYGSVLTAWGLAGIVGPQMVAFLKDNFAQSAAHYTFMTAAILLGIGFLATLRLSTKRFS